MSNDKLPKWILLLEESLQEAKNSKGEGRVLTVKKYASTHFVNVMVEKPFYAKLEKVAEELGTTPEVVINNALLLIAKRLEERVGSEK